MVKIKVINKSGNSLPSKGSELAAGYDLRADLGEPVTVFPFDRIAIPTGIFIKLPERYEAQIRPRSGLALKHGITVLNSPGTIDADYIGEIKVILYNGSKHRYTVSAGDRIAQMVISKYDNIEWHIVDDLEETERGRFGFGHTGIK